MKKFYTYTYLREDGTPYYVGKGHGKRAYALHHGFPAPSDLSRIIIEYHDSEAQAFEAEIFLISFYGRIDLGTGCLRNRTDGGENPPNHTGKKRSAEFRAKMRVVAHGRRPSLEACAKGGRTAGLNPSVRERHPSLEACRKGGRMAALKYPDKQARVGRLAGQRAVASGQILAIRTDESCSKGGLFGTHARWHVARNIRKDGCSLCQ